MKKITITCFVLGVVSTAAIISSCGSKKVPGRVYMPDMAYSRAFETYAMHDTTLYTTEAIKRGGNMIFYNSMPVQSTLRRGDLFPYTLPNNTDGYLQSAGIKNPLVDSLSVPTLAEAGRLFNINCAICHGEKAAGNGPLATSGKVGGIANLTLPNYIAMPDGTMFHSVTYGKGVMGSYASQLSRLQRWEIIKYIRTLQKPASAVGANDSSTAKKSYSSGIKKI